MKPEDKIIIGIWMIAISAVGIVFGFWLIITSLF
jgi:hypothetical protein